MSCTFIENRIRFALFMLVPIAALFAADPVSAQGIQRVSGARVQQSVMRTSTSASRSSKTDNQRVRLPRTALTAMGHIPQVSGMRNGLPPTQLDSFVLNAGVFAEHIYGDESTSFQPPPYDHFTEAHRINTGIRGERNVGLTTGHGSYMPSAVGHDEFLGNEWNQSGPRTYVFEEVPYKNRKVYEYEPEQFPFGYRVNPDTYYSEPRFIFIKN